MLKVMWQGFVQAILKKNHDVLDLFIAGLGSSAIFIWLSGIGSVVYFLFYLVLVFGKTYLEYRIRQNEINEKYGVN